MTNKQQVDKKNLKAKVAKDIVNLLALAEGLTVSDGVEILGGCQNVIREQADETMQRVMREEGERPLSHALTHLNLSNIQIVR